MFQGGHELTNLFKKIFKNDSILSLTENSNNLISKNNIVKSSIKLAVNA